ncbi:unnamed protein product, partial [Laminaria digitata]
MHQQHERRVVFCRPCVTCPLSSISVVYMLIPAQQSKQSKLTSPTTQNVARKNRELFVYFLGGRRIVPVPSTTRYSYCCFKREDTNVYVDVQCRTDHTWSASKNHMLSTST